MKLPKWLRKDRHLDMLRELEPFRSLPMDTWLREVPRHRGTHEDFFDAAALFHFGYVNTTTLASQGRPAGQLGDDIDDTAQILCQFMLAPGASFALDGCAPRERWDPGGFRVFVTELGIEKLNELENRALDRRLLTWATLLGAVVGSVMTSVAQRL